MKDYKFMYFKLAAKVADAVDLLVKVQQECEENFITMGDTTNINELTNTISDE